MNIFQYLIYLGIVQLLYSFIFKWVSLVLALILVSLRIEKWGIYLVKTFNYYLYVSILGILTLHAIGNNSSFLYGLLIVLIGLFFAFISIGGGMNEGEKEARRTFAFEALEGMKYDVYFLFGALIYFIIVLFLPSLATTFPVQILLSLIGWVYGLPIIGFLLGIYGVFSMLGTFSQAFIMGGAGIFLLVDKFRKNKKVSEDKNDQSLTLSKLTTDEVDPLINEAIDILTQYDLVSTPLFQRRLAIGWSRASEIINTLSAYELISKSDNEDTPRNVLVKDISELNNFKNHFNSLPKYDTTKFGEEENVISLDNNSRDSIYSEVREFIKGKREISATILQNKFNIGYARASRIMDHLEEDGILNDKERAKKEGILIEKTLEAFGIRTRIVEINIKKNGVEYCLEVELGASIKDLSGLDKDIALAVASPTGKVKIQAPIPGRSLIGIFVPAKKPVKK